MKHIKKVQPKKVVKAQPSKQDALGLRCVPSGNPPDRD